MVLILARPVVVPDPRPSPWQHLSMVWVGWDGSTWDLGTGEEGVRLLRDGVEGLHFPPIEKWSSRSSAFPGKRPRGWQALERAVFWPLRIRAQSSEEWRVLQDRFFNTIHPSRHGEWQVQAGTQVRRVRLTGTFEDPHTHPLDPYARGLGIYGVTLEADRPYWSGDPISAGPWSAVEEVDFFDAEGSPPFHISASNSPTTASFTNPGDVDAYPVWTVVGPADDIELGVGSRVIDVPFAVAEGETLLIDTDPRNITATLNGVDVTEDLGFQRFAPIPAKATTSLHVLATGEGSVSVSLTPLYFRAF
ncbi:hypothetical protein [Microbacterium sp. 2FI]|uniref:hypothetical protein n=1 Tax=Microbacterium sp. 2FI TaxID=2502193 RepID=UPI0010F76B7A|nr:hypothetical protein [Microbacterium sp. 2FI]